MIRAVEVVRAAGMLEVVITGGCTNWDCFDGRVVRESKVPVPGGHHCHGPSGINDNP